MWGTAVYILIGMGGGCWSFFDPGCLNLNTGRAPKGGSGGRTKPGFLSPSPGAWSWARGTGRGLGGGRGGLGEFSGPEAWRPARLVLLSLSSKIRGDGCAPGGLGTLVFWTRSVGQTPKVPVTAFQWWASDGTLESGRPAGVQRDRVVGMSGSLL